MSNKKNIVGAQVSSLRPYLQTPQELRTSLQKLADMGYRTVQMQWWTRSSSRSLLPPPCGTPGLPAFPRKTSTQPYGMISSAPCA